MRIRYARESMRLSKVIEHLYLKVIVGIVVSRNKSSVVIELVKGSEVKERVAKSFETGGVSDEMIAFITPYLSESPFHYVALLNPMSEQGALPTCSLNKAQEFTDISTAVTLCQDKSWMVYASKPELDDLQSRFAKPGLDFIFSPFVLTEKFFADKTESDISLYILVEEDAVNVSVFAHKKLLFAEHLEMDIEDDEALIDHDEEDTISLSFELEADGIAEGIDLDDINAIDDLEGLDDLNDIEDLDVIDDIDSFEEESPAESEEEGLLDDVPDDEVSLESFNKDFKRFQLIQNSLHHFYTNAKFQSEFIESVYVADGCGVSDDLKNYLEEELFLKVYVRRIDLANEVVELAKLEAKHAV